MKRNFTILLVLTSAGLLFSGYLSAVKLFTNTCALKEPCPYFLGHPACWYGFGMYLLLWLATLGGMFGKIKGVKVFAIDSVIAFLGILFAGRFFLAELLNSRITGTLGLSTCTYGLIFYIAIFAVSLLAFRQPRTTKLL
jgi:hypothetical protein